MGTAVSADGAGELSLSSGWVGRLYTHALACKSAAPVHLSWTPVEVLLLISGNKVNPFGMVMVEKYLSIILWASCRTLTVTTSGRTALFSSWLHSCSKYVPN